MTSPTNTGGRFTAAAANGILVCTVYELRALRRAIGLGQREFAALLSVRLETLRTCDSGRRPIPAPVLQRATVAVAHHKRQNELLPLDQLAKELGVHIRTVQAAARTGRLEAHFSVRSVFGRPIRFASRAVGERFLAKHYRCFSGQQVCPLQLRIVPHDCDTYLRDLRRWMRLTQGALAQRIGAAGKPVCISGNRGSEYLHPCCGNACSSWNTTNSGQVKAIHSAGDTNEACAVTKAICARPKNTAASVNEVFSLGIGVGVCIKESLCAV